MAINSPSIVDLSKRVDSRYTLVVEASKRARDLISKEASPLFETNLNKPLKIAVEEINRGLISFIRKDTEE